MKLRQLAHVRTGDKGDVSQIAVIAYEARDYPRLREVLTAERVCAFYAALPCRAARRHEAAALGALIFTLEGALKGGVTRSLALDAHGKTIGALLLDLDLEDMPHDDLQPEADPAYGAGRRLVRAAGHGAPRQVRHR